MKKKFKHTEVHPFATCMDCGKRIKMNVFERQDTVTTCFRCHKRRHPGHSKRNMAIWPKHGNEFAGSEKGLRTA